MQINYILRLIKIHHKNRITVDTDGKDFVKGDTIFCNEHFSLNVLTVFVRIWYILKSCYYFYLTKQKCQRAQFGIISSMNTAENTVISPNFLVWKFRGKPHQEIRWNCGIFRSGMFLYQIYFILLSTFS